MNELQIFTYQSNEVRTIQKDGEPWFVLKDVCGVLGLSDTNKTAERLDSDELTRTKLVSGGQEREMYIINESGLYNVVLRSDKPEAKAFKRWVTHDVLPRLRKKGAYGISSQVRQLADAQKSLDQWRDITKKFEQITADACREYDRSRKWYDDCRARRDACRQHTQTAAELVDALVALITLDA